MSPLRGLPGRRSPARKVVAVIAAGAAVAVAVGASVAGARSVRPATPAVSDQLQADFAAAAREFRVPAPVLLGVSYALTGWRAGSGPDPADGLGPMHLTAGSAAPVSAVAFAGTHLAPSAAALAGDPALHTLAVAARLLDEPADRLRTDPRENIRGGAALLAHYQSEQPAGHRPGGLLGWYGAVARYGTGGDAMTGRSFADDVFALLRRGVPLSVVAGHRLALPASPSLRLPTLPGQAPAGTAGAAECPAGLDCRFVPAAYSPADPAQPGAYGNYDPANRPADGNLIRFVVLHAVTGSYDAAIAADQRPTTQASVHYAISSTGQLTQLVRVADIAWHSGNPSFDAESIGVAVEPAAGSGGFTDAALSSAARLVRWLAGRYGIALDRQHILGGDEVPVLSATSATRPAADPGRSWDWPRYLAAVGAPLQPQGWGAGQAVTISAFSAGGGNALPLRRGPSDAATLLPGVAVAGQSFAVAGRQNGWVGIWYGGQQAWLHDPAGLLAVPAAAALVTPAPGRNLVRVYASPYPEAGAYPAGLAVPAAAVLSQTIGAGQEYVLTDPVAAHFYAGRYNASGLTTGTVVAGARRYMMITFDHRQAFVDAGDVAIVGLPGS